jgi:hypothetical protein
MLMEISMMVCKKRFLVVCLVLFFVPGLSPNLCRAQSSLSIHFDPAKLPWHRLSFKADNFFGRVATSVRLAAMPAKEAADLLLAVPQADALQPSGATVISITIDSNINPMIGPKEILNTQSLCNPNNAAALQRLRLRQGGKIWQKSYRFLPNGVYHQRKKPADEKQLKLPPNQWKTFEQRWYQYDRSHPECPAILEPSELLYLVSVVDIAAQKGPLGLCVFDKSQLHRLTVTAGGTQQLKVNYLEGPPDKQIRREGAIEVIKISFQPHPLDPADKKLEEFSFLGLQGDFEIYVAGATRVPVQISGQIPGIGKLDIRLDEVEF